MITRGVDLSGWPSQVASLFGGGWLGPRDLGVAQPDLAGGSARLHILCSNAGCVCVVARPDLGIGGWSCPRVAGGPATHQIGLSPPLTRYGGTRFLNKPRLPIIRPTGPHFR